MTEAGMIASNPYGGARVAGTVGYPLPDTEARIQGGGDGPGVLEIRGAGLFSGYLRLPDHTAEEQAGGGRVLTGDIPTSSDARGIANTGLAKDLILPGVDNTHHQP